MNKKECLDRYFELGKGYEHINDQLYKLHKQGKITAGEYYFIYNPYEWYGDKRITEILEKASKAKNYSRYLKRTSLWSWNYYIEDIEKNYKKTIDFIQSKLL
jgi:hypothetical protein